MQCIHVVSLNFAIYATTPSDEYTHVYMQMYVMHVHIIKKNRKWIVHVAYRFFLFPSKHTFSHECLKWCNQLLLKPQFYLFSIIIHYSCFHFGWKIMPIISISYCRWKFFRVWGGLKIEPNNFPWNHRHAQQNTLSAF